MTDMVKASSPKSVSPLWRNTLIVLLVVSCIFLRDFLMLIALAALTTYLFSPLYERVMRRTKKPALSVFITMISAFLLVLLPLTIVLGVTVIEANSIVRDVQSTEFRSGINDATSSVKSVIENTNEVLSRANIDYKLDRGVLTQKVQEQLPKIMSGIATFLSNALGGVPRFFTFLILYLFLFGAMLRSKKQILETIKAVSPFDDRINELYFRKIGLMTSAMVKGQFIIALVQGVIGAVSLWIAGVDYIFFFGVVLTFLSFIPLGGGILTLPIAGVLFISGNYWQGIFIAMVHFVVVTNIDNFLRGKLVHKEAYLPTSLVLVGTFAGVGLFGLIGVVYGPIIMIALMTTLTLYLEETKRTHITKKI